MSALVGECTKKKKKKKKKKNMKIENQICYTHSPFLPPVNSNMLIIKYFVDGFVQLFQGQKTVYINENTSINR